MSENNDELSEPNRPASKNELVQPSQMEINMDDDKYSDLFSDIYGGSPYYFNDDLLPDNFSVNPDDENFSFTKSSLLEGLKGIFPPNCQDTQVLEQKTHCASNELANPFQNNQQGNDKLENTLVKEMDDFSFLDIPVGLPDEVLSSSQSEVVNVNDYLQQGLIANQDSSSKTKVSENKSQQNAEGLSKGKYVERVGSSTSQQMDFQTQFMNVTCCSLKHNHVNFCSFCSEIFGSVEQVKHHAFRSHNNMLPYKCNQCQLGFFIWFGSSCYGYPGHDCRNSTQLECKKCCLVFSSWNHLAQHAKLHADQDAFYEKEFLRFCQSFRCRECLTIGTYEKAKRGTSAKTDKNTRFVKPRVKKDVTKSSRKKVVSTPSKKLPSSAGCSGRNVQPAMASALDQASTSHVGSNNIMEPRTSSVNDVGQTSDTVTHTGFHPDVNYFWDL